METKKVALKKCIYCLVRDANSSDHIISKSLFADTSSVDFNGYTVPSCKTCNRGYSKDEEFLRNTITNSGYEYSENARRLIYGKIARSMRRKPALGLSLFKKMELVDVFTSNGLWLGKRTKMTLIPEDKKRIENVLGKYTRGLFFKHLGVPMPEHFRVKVAWPDQLDSVENILGKIKPSIRFGDVLTYGYNYVDGTHNAVWLFVFYSKIPFLVFSVGPEVGGHQT